jgi:hypothetical protein
MTALLLNLFVAPATKAASTAAALDDALSDASVRGTARRRGNARDFLGTDLPSRLVLSHLCCLPSQNVPFLAAEGLCKPRSPLVVSPASSEA